ncbi:hypothetical protein [Actinorhabdospora filicis]|uniref:hypothetical protein n=1 Tax=Actinorhabdospora filicis TaxID=1785913 RepID=UPI0025570DE8|nr:hypothetical protein [Actinorhabdospora filicis]
MTVVFVVPVLVMPVLMTAVLASVPEPLKTTLAASLATPRPTLAHLGPGVLVV